MDRIFAVLITVTVIAAAVMPAAYAVVAVA